MKHSVGTDYQFIEILGGQVDLAQPQPWMLDYLGEVGRSQHIVVGGSAIDGDHLAAARQQHIDQM
jgi:hypothetical protein